MSPPYMSLPAIEARAGAMRARPDTRCDRYPGQIMSDPARPPGAPLPASGTAATPPPQGHPSITHAPWAASWMAGSAPPDHVIAAMHAWAQRHVVAVDEAAARACGPVGPQGSPDVGPVALLALLRLLGPELRLQVSLPAPGDVAGITAGSAHADAALRAGETLVAHRVVAGTDSCGGCVGLVPVRESDDVLHWRAYDAQCRGVVVAPPALGETRRALRESVRRAGAILGGMARVGGTGGDSRELVAAHLDRAGRHVAPPGTPPRAAELFDS